MNAVQFIFIPHDGRSARPRPCIAEIQNVVADLYGIRHVDMFSDRRSRSIAWPRQIAMYLCRDLTTHSLPAIGRMFGGRDHTTVLHAVRKVEAYMETDAGAAEIDHARRAVGA